MCKAGQAGVNRENLKTPPIALTIGEAIFSHGRSHTVLGSILDSSGPEDKPRGWHFPWVRCGGCIISFAPRLN